MVSFLPSHVCKKFKTSNIATEGKTTACLANAVNKPSTHLLTCNQVSAHKRGPTPPSNAWAIRDKPNS